jgi:serine phosphatase RsbU (regulator of sigma subunit)
MCAPLLTPEGAPLGILQLDTTDKKQFNQEDIDLLVAVAGQASIALQNAAMHETILAGERLDRDLRLAEQIQKRFIPQEVPEVDGFEFFAHYQAAYEVGGDFYDFIDLPGGRLAVALGDVAGKGVSAALMMAKFSGDARYCILTEDAPGPAADRLNSLLMEAGIEEKFITLCLGVIDPGSRQFTFCSAGHPPILVRRKDGRVEPYGDEISNFPLGILDGSHYPQATVDLQDGDVVLIYSDGATDGRNGRGELYDTSENPRLLQRLAASAGGPGAIGKAILQATREFSAGVRQADDLTLVCFGPVARPASKA